MLTVVIDDVGMKDDAELAHVVKYSLESRWWARFVRPGVFLSRFLPTSTYSSWVHLATPVRNTPSPHWSSQIFSHAHNLPHFRLSQKNATPIVPTVAYVLLSARRHLL